MLFGKFWVHLQETPRPGLNISGGPLPKGSPVRWSWQIIPITRSPSPGNSAALARQLGIGEVILVINRAQEENELQNTCGNSGGLAEFSETVVLPFDLEVSRTEPAVTPLFGGESVFMKNVGVSRQPLPPV